MSLALRARPDLPRPGCRVRLVCGPPAAGKSTHVAQHASANDVVIDVDAIAQERGLGRDRPAAAIGDLLDERNARLAALADEPSTRTAWVILTAPSPALRAWWCETLGVAPDDMVLLLPSREELQRRIIADPDRRYVTGLYLDLVAQWFARERANDPGILRPGWDESGIPLDPLHPWNR